MRIERMPASLSQRYHLDADADADADACCDQRERDEKLAVRRRAVAAWTKDMPAAIAPVAMSYALHVSG